MALSHLRFLCLHEAQAWRARVGRAGNGGTMKGAVSVDLAIIKKRDSFCYLLWLLGMWRVWIMEWEVKQEKRLAGESGVLYGAAGTAAER